MLKNAFLLDKMIAKNSAVQNAGNELTNLFVWFFFTKRNENILAIEFEYREEF